MRRGDELRQALHEAVRTRIAAENELASFRPSPFADLEDAEAAVRAARYDEATARRDLIE